MNQSSSPPTVPRRSFLTLLTASSVTVGGVVCTWPFINSLNTQNTTITHNYTDVDISSLKEGQQITVMWQGHAVFILHRPAKTLALLQDKELLIRLRDPSSKELQQPPYTRNWHRSIQPEIAVLIGVCTHLGCIPSLNLGNSFGGYYNCACHGSKFDLAGRVYNNVPAPYNLPVPPYKILKPGILRIGENPEGENFSFTSIMQL